jgi:serine/threonine protein kinase
MTKVRRDLAHSTLTNPRVEQVVGTTYTAAPEVFKESYDERCDVWSIGVSVCVSVCVCV